MSLINEALRKARLEAARQDSAQRGIRYPAAGEPRRASRLAPVITAVVLVAVVGALLYWLGHRSAADAGTSEPARIAEQSTDRTSATPPPRQPAPRQQTSEPPSPAAVDRPPAPLADPRPAPRETVSTARAADRPERPNDLSVRGTPNQPPPSAPPAPTEPPATADPAASNNPGIATPPATRPEPRPGPEPPARTTNGRSPRVDPAPSAEPMSVATNPQSPPAASSRPEPEAGQTFVREATIPGVGNFRLGGIAWSERQPYALINGQVVGPGDRIQGLLVSSVGKAKVVLTATGGTTYILRIR